jgi:hypothetical protein
MPGKPGWQVTNDKVEASRAMLCVGHEAPVDLRPLTRVAVRYSRDNPKRQPDPPEPQFTGREGAAGGGSTGYVPPMLSADAAVSARFI